MPDFFDFDVDAAYRDLWGTWAGNNTSSREVNILLYSNALLSALQTLPISPRLQEPNKLYVDQQDGTLHTYSSRDVASGAFANAQRLYSRELAEFISEGIGLFDSLGNQLGSYDTAYAELREEDSVHETTGGGGARAGGVPWDGSPAGSGQSSGGAAGGGNNRSPGGGTGTGGGAGGGGGGGGGNPPPPGSSTNGVGLSGNASLRAPEFVQGTARLTAAAMSQRVSGPVEVGQDGDKHLLGVTRDDNQINSAHFNVLTYWYRDNEYDAPILFEEEVYKNESSPKFITRSHLRYDPRMDHPFVLGTRSGFWRIQGRCHQTYVDVPPNPPVGPPHHSFEPIGPWGTGSPPDIPVGSPNLQLQPGHLFRPQPLGEGWADMRGTVVDHPMAQYNIDKYGPVVARVESYVASIGDSFDYTMHPGQGSRYAGGTAPGGVIHLPPELGIEDHVSGFAPDGVSLSTVHDLYVPGVYMAVGYPDLETGGIHTGYRWSGDDSGHITYQRVDADGVATDVLTMTQEGAFDTKALAGTPATPAAGYTTIFTMDDGVYCVLDDGTVIGPFVDTVGGGGYTDEQARDAVAAFIQNGTGISWSHNDGADTLTPTVTLAPFSTTNLAEGSNLYFTDERVDDRVAALIQNGTGITWSYNDGLNTFTPTVTITQYTDELAQDAVGTILDDGGDIDFTYDDATPKITAVVKSGTVSNTKLADMNAWTLKGRNLGSSGDPQDIALADLFVEASPASGDFFLMFLADGSLAVVDWAELPAGGSGTLTTEAHTGNDTLTSGESGSQHTNQGAAGTVELTLPSAAAGLQFYFYIDAAQSFRVKVAAGDSITVSGVAGTANAQSSAVGNSLHLTCLDATKWVAQTSVGSWTVT